MNLQFPLHEAIESNGYLTYHYSLMDNRTITTRNLAMGEIHVIRTVSNRQGKRVTHKTPTLLAGPLILLLLAPVHRNVRIGLDIDGFHST